MRVRIGRTGSLRQRSRAVPRYSRHTKASFGSRPSVSASSRRSIPVPSSSPPSCHRQVLNPGLGARRGPGRARARAARRTRSDDALAQLAETFGLQPAERISAALTALEVEGFALAGSFTPGGSEREWCERRLLARIHRYTVKRLRAEIEPVSARDYLRFLLDWQGVSADARREGRGGARRRGRAARGLRGTGRCMGRARSCPRDCRTTSRACSTMPASRGASPGRGSDRRGKPKSNGRRTAPLKSTPISLFPAQGGRGLDAAAR